MEEGFSFTDGQIGVICFCLERYRDRCPGSPPLVEKGVGRVIVIHIILFIHGVILHNRCSPLAYKRYSVSNPFSPIVPFSILSIYSLLLYLLLLMLLSLYYGICTSYMYVTAHQSHPMKLLLCHSIPLPYYYAWVYWDVLCKPYYHTWLSCPYIVIVNTP